MKLGVLTLWTNGMSATPALHDRRGASEPRALAPRAPSKRSGEVAPLTERHAAHDDVLGADAKPLFAVDDLAYALVAPPAPASKPRRKKAAPRARKRVTARPHA